MYRGHKGKPSIILKAVATKYLRIWHAYFGMLGSHNDINVLQRSPVFDDLANGRAPIMNFTLNGNEYNMGYYLVDGIYLDWATLIKSVSSPLGNKCKWFAERQESCRKDVERTFGVRRARFKILHCPGRLWRQADLNAIMTTCIVLHNLIVEDERGVELPVVRNHE
jgi:hypothetical protein